MRERVATLEAIIPTLATKADLVGEIGSLRSEMLKGFADQTKWIIGTAFAGIAVFITVMTFVLNNAVPKAAPATPTVIVVPFAGAATAQSAASGALSGQSPPPK